MKYRLLSSIEHRVSVSVEHRRSLVIKRRLAASSEHRLSASSEHRLTALVKHLPCSSITRRLSVSVERAPAVQRASTLHVDQVSDQASTLSVVSVFILSLDRASTQSLSAHRGSTSPSIRVLVLINYRHSEQVLLNIDSQCRSSIGSEGRLSRDHHRQSGSDSAPEH
eukprot:3659818-Rhodomonas_salina.3